MSNDINQLIAELRAKLPADAHIELIDDTVPDDDETLPAELIAQIDAAAKELAEIIGGKVASLPLMKISAIDDSQESLKAMAALKGKIARRGAMRSASCYHYILDSKGNPVHCEDSKALQRFQKKRRDVVAETNVTCDDLLMKVVTAFTVHNPMIGDELPPAPTWVTSVICVNSGDVGFQCCTKNRDKVMKMHREICVQTRKAAGEQHRKRRPSPRRVKVAQRLISEGRDVLTGKPKDHTALIQRVLRATVGSEEAQRFTAQKLREAFGGQEHTDA